MVLIQKKMIIALCLLLISSFSVSKELLVEDKSQFKSALKSALPGDSIVLKNGVWTDFEIGFFAEGSKEKPITLRAQTPGQVILSGLSNLRLAGDYLIVEGLVFKNGYTPTGEVISFKRNDEYLANNSRVTQVVVENFNNPDRDSHDYWVALYGKNNRFDHSYLAGKRNLGVTMAVRLESEKSQENFHQIDHNYFGPRPTLGSNGGETLRVGTSTYSLTNSNTLIENNYFDRCDGEVEIISIKSGKNIIRNNVFFESRGTLTLRHGNGNLVEGNVFWGNGVPNTGGIRVINSDQIVRNNYLEGLTGNRFGSGFAVMNGTIDAPINRYGQVVNALIENNSFINIDNIQLGAGSDAERDAPPTQSTMKNNLVYNESGVDVFSLYDDMSGISFSGNVLNKVKNPVMKQGFVSKAVKVKANAAGLLVPQGEDYKDVGAPANLKPVSKADVGPKWYEKKNQRVEFDSGKVVEVSSQEEDALNQAILSAKSGDQLVLAPGEHKVNKLLQINKVLTIRAKKPGSAVLLGERATLFEIQNGGSLKLSGLVIDGASSPDSAGNILLRTQKSGMYVSYRFIMEKVKVTNLNVNHSFHFFNAGSRSLAELIQVTDSEFTNVTGDLFRLDKEIDDLGNYNADNLLIKNNRFANIDGVLLSVYRGGTDESTFGPKFEFSGNRIDKVGAGSRNKRKASLYLHGVQYARITKNHFSDSAGLVIEHTVGDPDTEIRDNRFVNVPKLVTAELHTKGDSTIKYVNNKDK